MLQLSFWEFDQTLGEGWRAFSDLNESEKAAGLIEAYLAGRKGLNQGQIGYLHYHAFQLWSLSDSLQRGIPHIEQAHVDSIPSGFPQSFNTLVSGTRAFLAEDMEAVSRCRDEIAAMTNLSPSDSLFLQSLEHLCSQKGVPYPEAVRTMPE